MQTIEQLQDLLGNQGVEGRGHLIADDELRLGGKRTGDNWRDNKHWVAGAIQRGGNVRLERRLYLANPAEIIDVIHEAAGDAARVMVVGHNPGLEELVARLGGSGEAIPTAALAEIQLDIAAWSDLSVRSPGRVVNVWRPRELPPDEG